MKCPLMTAGRMTCDDPLDFTYIDCLKEECAWWDPDYKLCAVLAIPFTSHILNVELREIRKKMP